MKRKTTALLLSAAMLVSLAACGGGQKPAETTAAAKATAAATTAAPATAAPAPTEAPFVEEEPAKNELDPASPIPAINKEYDLTEQVFEDENLRLMLPEGVEAVNEGRGENLGHITVTDKEDGWKLMFRPTNFALGNIVNNVQTSVKYDGNWVKTDWSQDVPGTLAGFPARVWANNIREGWLHPSNETDTPAVDIILDYGETLVGEWLGMQIRLEALDPQKATDIYHYLYNSKLRAVLNSFELIETPDGKEFTTNGITATFPARWPVKAGGTSLVANLRSKALTGGITLTTMLNPDLQYQLDLRGTDQFERTYGGADWKGVIEETEFQKSEEETKTVYTMHLFAPFNDERCADVHVACPGWGPDDYKAFLDNPQFTALMESVKLDPASWQKPGMAAADGFVSNQGVLESYNGSETDITIPAVIGEYDTREIGTGAFKDNSELRSVVIPEGVAEIGANAFLGCTNLETVVLPDTLIYIEQNAFRDCPNLKDVTLPESVAFVGTAAFNGSGTGTFTGGAVQYGSHAFTGSTFEKIVLGSGSDISADYMFSDAQASEVVLPDDLEVLGAYAFTGCRNLEEIRLPETVRVLGEYAVTDMGGLMRLNLPEGIEELPDGLTSSTTTDVIVVPKSVKRIGSEAIYDANIVVIQNPEVEIAIGGVDGDYVYLEDAKNFVFDGEGGEKMRGSRIYLDGVYDPANEIQGDFYNATGFSSQVFLPMDAVEAESDELDAYLLSIGYEEIAWIAGSDKDFLPDSTWDFESEKNTITGYRGSGSKICIPDYVMQTDGTFWFTQNVYSIAEGAFAGKGITSAYFRGNCGDGTGARVLADNPDLKDIWFNMQVLYDADKSIYDPAAFEGVPENVTVHLPESLNDEQRGKVEEFLHSVGIPAGASFEYYSLRG